MEKKLIFIMMLCLVLAVSSAQGDMISYWSFDEHPPGTVGPFDPVPEPVCGNVGILQEPTVGAGYTKYIAGKIGSGMSFDYDFIPEGSPGYEGDPVGKCCHMITTKTFPMSSTSVYSISTWFKAPDISYGKKIVGIESDNTSSAAYYDLNLYMGNDGHIYFAVGAGSSPKPTVYVRSVADLRGSVWHHAAAVYNAGVLELYIDGVSQGTDTGTPLPRTYPTGGYWRVAAYQLRTNVYPGFDPNFNANAYFKGAVDDIRIFDHALSVPEVNELAAGSAPTYYTVSGTVTYSGSPLEGVTMSGLPGNPDTNASGVYSSLVISGWSGTVTPTKLEYTFTPRVYTNVTSDQTSQDYTATYTPDLTAPTPNPMTWASVPVATGPNSITMTATTATEPNYPPVQYYFECTNHPEANSTWQTSTTYVATGLAPSTQYTFRVKACDGAPAQNETGWSGPASAITTTAPLAYVAAGTVTSGAGAAPTYQAAGTAVSGAAVAVTPTWPTHQANDIALLFVEAAGGDAISLTTANGFVQVPNSPQATGTGTAGTRIAVYWCRATSAGMSAPVVAATADHTYARILTFRGVIATGDPWDATDGGVKATASTSVTATGVTTTVANTLVVVGVTKDLDATATFVSAWANGNLASITERTDGGTDLGLGGGHAVATGVKSAAGATGNTTATVTSSINAFLTIALKPVTATGAITPAWPAHQANDIALLVVETANQAVTLSTPAGFVEVTNSPQGTGTAAGTAATQLSVFWKRAASSVESNPTVADSGDHQIAQIITFRGVIATGDPWDVTAGNVAATASTAVSIPGATTTVANTLVVAIVANATDTTTAQTSGWTNANLTSVTERADSSTNQGNGGGFGVATGVKATAGAYVATTATLATSSVQGRMSIALKPEAGVNPPGQASSPSPTDTATSVGVTTDLGWTADPNATLHDVYFGTNPSPGVSEFKGSQAGTTYDPGTLAASTTYYWRIDEKNAGGATTGVVWSFTTVSAGLYTISGNAGIDGAVMNGLPHTPVSDADGNYSDTVNSGWTGTVIPAKAGYTFSPASRDYNDVTSDQLNQGYTATLNTYTISGNAGVSGATMNGLPNTPVSEADGNYSDTVDSGWTGTVTPAKAGYTFSPASKDYNNVTSDQLGQDYTATLNKYTISGNAEVSGATMDGLPNAPVSGPGGDYNDIVDYNWSGTVTPAKAGYTFSPASKDYSNVTSDQLGQDYTATLNKYTISGNAGVSGATMDGLPNAPVSGPGGDYNDIVDYNWSGTVTPAKEGYTFSPASKDYSNVMSDQLNQDYTATFNTYTISGNILEPDANIPVEGVLVDANNNGGSTDTTDANGYYEVVVPYNWSGTATPIKEGYTFEPNSISYSDVIANEVNDYIATLTTYVISGYITESEGNAPINDVNVSAENGGGPYTSRYGGGQDTTDVNGYYEVLVDYNWSGNVVPSKYAYAFEPNSRYYADVNEDTADQDYIGTLLTYRITGYIKNECNVPIEDVVVNGGGQGTTDVNGFYEVWVDYNWSGTVTPSKAHYTFEPNLMSYVDVLADQPDQNYAAHNIYDLDYDCYIGWGDVAVISENWLRIGGLKPNCVGHWKMNDNAASTTVLDSSGNGKNGTAVRNTNLLAVEGKINGALTFNGTTDFVNVGNVIGTGAYTKVAWIKRIVDARDFHNIVSSNTLSNSLWHDRNGYLKAGHATSYEHVKDGNALAEGVWYYVAVTFDPNVGSGTMKLYKNGNQVGNTATSVPTQPPSTTTYIGRFLSTNAYNFNGSIDNVMILNRALTGEEISLLYNNGNGTETIPGSGIDSDFNNDGIVNFLDFAEFGLAW